MKSLAIALLLMLPVAAFAADAPQPTMQDLLSRAVLRATIEREQLEDRIQQLQQELQSQKAPAPAAPAEK